jgi:hypothetical protein
MVMVRATALKHRLMIEIISAGVTAFISVECMPPAENGKAAVSNSVQIGRSSVRISNRIQMLLLSSHGS